MVLSDFELRFAEHDFTFLIGHLTPALFFRQNLNAAFHSGSIGNYVMPPLDVRIIGEIDIPAIRDFESKGN